MGKYIQYKRISKIVTPEELNAELKNAVEGGYEIIHYDEKILEKSATIERIVLTMVLGKVNEGTKLL